MYGPLFAGEMARLLRPAVCASLMPGAWLSTFAAPAARLGDEDFIGSYWRSRDTHLRAAGQSSSSASSHQTESLAETASRLLFSLLGWVSTIPSFSTLAHSDQVERILHTRCTAHYRHHLCPIHTAMTPTRQKSFVVSGNIQ